MRMPEDEREVSDDPEEDVKWDSDRNLEWWIDGVSDAEIGGYKDVD